MGAEEQRGSRGRPKPLQEVEDHHRATPSPCGGCGGPEDPSEARVDPGGGGTQTELTEDSARLEVLSAPTTAPPVSPPPAGPA